MPWPFPTWAINPTTLLQEVSGKQRYIWIIDGSCAATTATGGYKPFCFPLGILQQLTASLCNAVTERTSSQQMLEQIEQANLFVVSLDSKRQWYRYHALFAEALCHQLEQTQPDLVPSLHHRASLWYAKHNQTTEAILHAFKPVSGSELLI